MKNAERTVKSTSTPATGLLAKLSNLLRSKGTGASSSRRARATLALAIAAFAFTAAPASAAPPTTTMPEVSDVSYTSVHVEGKVTSDGSGLLGATTYSFQYSTDETNWSTGFTETFPFFTGAFTDKPVEGNITTGLKADTKYFIRLAANNGTSATGPADEATSPEPNPSFTTLPVDPPTIIATDDASGVFSTSVTASGTVKRPANPDPAFNVSCRFEYVTQADFAATAYENAVARDCQPNLIGPDDANVDKAVTAALGCTNPVIEGPEEGEKCLKPATTYRLRMVTENASPTVVIKEATNTFTTLPPVAKPPVLATADASEVGKHSANVSGSVERPAGDDPALNTSCRFEFVTDQQFNENPPGEEFAGAGQTPCVEAPPEAPLTSTSTGPTPVSAELSGLASGPTGVSYHLRLAASNGGGTLTREAADTFTTSPIIDATATIDSITEIGYTSFRVTGTFDPGNEGVYPFFQVSQLGADEWGKLGETGFGTSPRIVPNSPAQQMSSKFPCSSASPCNFEPLKPGTTYEVRAHGRQGPDNGPWTEIYSPEPNPEFTTKGTSTPPSASCDPATAITGTSAHLSCAVDPHAPSEALNEEARSAYRTDWRVECTPECPGAPSGTIEGEEGSQSIDFTVSHLDTNTTYQVKLIAHNTLATVESEQTFETPLVAPSVKNLPGGSDGEGGYVLAGVVNPNHSEITACNFEWGPDSASYAFSAPCSPAAPGNGGNPVTVEAHLTGLNPDVVYHAKLVIKSDAFGADDDGDFEFTPTLAPKGPGCSNEELRKENNSLGLPECRAYEQVTYPNKQGFGSDFIDFNGGDALQYESGAENLANSGLGLINSKNQYVAVRSAAGWKTIADLNGPTGSPFSAPNFFGRPLEGTNGAGLFTPYLYSADLRSSIMPVHRVGGPPGYGAYLRRPDGSLELVGVGDARSSLIEPTLFGVSDDLTHVVISAPIGQTSWGPGVYEFIGTGNDEPRRVDVDNLGGAVSECPNGFGTVARATTVSNDGRVIVFNVNGTDGTCANVSPDEQGVAGDLWARVDGTTSYDISASLCTRANCNAPAPATFQGAAKDGSRIFFTTTQQLLDSDTDQGNDLYACDIPTTPHAPVDPANPCSALTRVSAAAGKAEVQKALSVSDDGSTVYFTAEGVLADNEDALGEEALPGDRNLYVWRTDPAHPAGHSAFVGRLPEGDGSVAQTTPDGRYLVLQTRGSLIDTDTDSALDIYRYDAASAELARVSTAVSGTGGNGEVFDATLGSLNGQSKGSERTPTPHNSHPAISDNGELIVFATGEALSPLDGNGEADAYLWKAGHLLGSVAPLVGRRKEINGEVVIDDGQVFIDGSGQNIYVQTAARLTATDVDVDLDVYDVRVGGGFAQHQEGCAGETCQPGATPVPPRKASSSEQPGSGNPSQPKPCSKGKVKKHGKCVKRSSKKHSGKKHHSKKHKRAGSNSGGGK